MSESHEPFEDPQLKAAITHALGRHQAAPALRARVMATVTSANAAQPQTASDRLRRLIRQPRVLGLAASILVVVAGTTLYVQHRIHLTEVHEAQLRAYQDLMLAMVAAHEGRSASQCHPVPQTPENTTMTNEQMAATLARPVPTVALVGWTVRSSTVYTLGMTQAACWHMTKDGKNVTVLAVPEAVVQGDARAYQYETTVEPYTIAGFVRGPDLICVVGDPSLTKSEVVTLRNELSRM